MPADVTQLNAAVQALTTQVASTEGVEASAVALIQGFTTQIQKAVTDALTADNAADQGSIDAAMTAINTVSSRFQTSAKALGDAVSAGSPPPPPPAKTGGA